MDNVTPIILAVLALLGNCQRTPETKVGNR